MFLYPLDVDVLFVGVIADQSIRTCAFQFNLDTAVTRICNYLFMSCVLCSEKSARFLYGQDGECLRRNHHQMREPARTNVLECTKNSKRERWK